MKKKILKSFLSVMTAAVAFAHPVAAAGWGQDAVGWSWYQENGSYSQNKWEWINGQWYWFDDTGYMVTGWKPIDGKWYYFETSGAMVTGWKPIDGKWYYFETSGAMVTDWKPIDGKWYYFETSGAMVTGWKPVNGKWYYFETSGAMVTGWKQIDGVWYYMEDSGAMAADRWVGNYYVESNGAMATSKWIGDYYVNESGLWTDTKEKHNWVNYTGAKVKNGYACGICYKDITDYDDYYDCHLNFHTHTFYLFPSYYQCSDCGKLLHRHYWYYNKPRYYANSNTIFTAGYWICFGCGNQSSDGKQVKPILVSDEGYPYGAISHWYTPFDFEKDSNQWVIEDEHWDPADDRPYLRSIGISGRVSMGVGDTYQYTVSFTPADPVEDKTVSWTSSDPSVVSIDENGKATALKLGTATITAVSHRCKDTSFVRVTEENVGHVRSAVLCINGQSNPNGELRIKKGTYPVKIQTNPEQAVYDVNYWIEQDKTNGLIADMADTSFQGNNTFWESGVFYTDSTTKMSFYGTGTVVVRATVNGITGSRIELSQKVVIE